MDVNWGQKVKNKIDRVDKNLFLIFFFCSDGTNFKLLLWMELIRALPTICSFQVTFGCSCSAGKASWIKVPLRGATQLTRARFPVAAKELGKKSSHTICGKTYEHRCKRLDWASSKKVPFSWEDHLRFINDPAVLKQVHDLGSIM